MQGFIRSLQIRINRNIVIEQVRDIEISWRHDISFKILRQDFHPKCHSTSWSNVPSSANTTPERGWRTDGSMLGRISARARHAPILIGAGLQSQKHIQVRTYHVLSSYHKMKWQNFKTKVCGVSMKRRRIAWLDLHVSRQTSHSGIEELLSSFLVHLRCNRPNNYHKSKVERIQQATYKSIPLSHYTLGK